MFHPNKLIRTFRSLEKLEEVAENQNNKKIWICGGQEIYSQLLPRCRDLFLTIVKREINGDRFFPEFESRFLKKKTLKETDEYKIVWYKNDDPQRISPNFDKAKESFPKSLEKIEEENVNQLVFSSFKV